jgi:hypothetical protein
MKNALYAIINSRYKWWLLGLLVATFAVRTGDDVSEIIIIGCIVSLLINLVSSFVTIIFIEERDQRELMKLEAERQSVIIDKLIRAINAYCEFFANVYKATAKEDITDIDKRSADMFYETDVLVKHLNMLDFCKEGYLISPQAVQRIQQGFEAKSMSWLDIFIMISRDYIESINIIQENYLFCIANPTIIQSIKKIAESKEKIKNLQGYNNFEFIRISQNILAPPIPDQILLYPEGISLKIPYVFFDTLNTIYHTKSVTIEIDAITQQKNFVINPTIFTRKGIDPQIGSGIDEKYVTEMNIH